MRVEGGTIVHVAAQKEPVVHARYSTSHAATEKVNAANDGRLVPCRTQAFRRGRYGGGRQRRAWRTQAGRDGKQPRSSRGRPG
eukprot:3754524-Pleurochrysis_carterae.AAC.1